LARTEPHTLLGELRTLPQIRRGTPLTTPLFLDAFGDSIMAPEAVGASVLA